MMLLAPKFLAGYSGRYVDAFGYPNFFVATALLGVAVLLLVCWCGWRPGSGADRPHQPHRLLIEDAPRLAQIGLVGTGRTGVGIAGRSAHQGEILALRRLNFLSVSVIF